MQFNLKSQYQTHPKADMHFLYFYFVSAFGFLSFLKNKK